MRPCLILFACCIFSLLGQGTPPRSFEIELPPSVASETVFVRYCLFGEFGDHCTWVLPKRDVTSYTISATHDGVPATHVKALVYVPGCKMETIDFVPTVWKEPRYPFACNPLPVLSLTGVLTRSDRLHGHNVELQAKYMAYWGRTFFGNTDGSITTIPVGDVAVLTADNHFEISIPDLFQDPLAGPADHPGVLQVWAKDPESGNLVAVLIPANHNLDEKTTNLGGLNIEPKYPANIVFVACAANEPHVHDHLHFSARSESSDACDR